MVPNQKVEVRRKATSPQTCYLLSLPAELRLLIYEAYFVNSSLRELHLHYEEENGFWYSPGGGSHDENTSALLRTCQQVYIEALPLHNASNVPYISNIPCPVPSNLSGHRKMLGPDQIRFLQQVPSLKLALSIPQSQLTSQIFLHQSDDVTLGGHVQGISWEHIERIRISFTGGATRAVFRMRPGNQELTMLVARLYGSSSVEGLGWAP
ncbi:hypothetical protein LTR56_018008 [Elasticomyces elasticus]|nr:hypothetical protein LTR56_018008 [Elasticomyces elasticus]KAK3663343.1 hypothetical protein LTR22_005750 [Elasticomyces elasticus]KAK4925422.1 hypothetical protein LTR49_007486 [Elasticomyces elasticus]KAK5764517.1 hypothetical protein LTS12_005247 [Elasticomyces elasticus]